MDTNSICIQPDHTYGVDQIMASRDEFNDLRAKIKQLQEELKSKDAASNSSKKRKLSSTQSQAPPNRPHVTVGETAGYRPRLCDEPPNSAVILASHETVNDKLLNSEVYKIYCKYKDPKEAMAQIENMKTCFGLSEPCYSPLDEDLVDRAIVKLRLVLNFNTKVL